MTHYDVLIIGSGPGGYVTAIRAAQLGFKTAVVEQAELGGICLNWGCIPTKALLHSADLFRQVCENSSGALVLDGHPEFDLPAAVSHSRAVAKSLNNGVAGLLHKNNVAVINGRGRVAGHGVVSVTPSEGYAYDLCATSIILATGARARGLTGLDLHHENVWTAREAMTPPKQPSSIVVVGAGAIGVEFASFYADIGTHVTLLEASNRILPVEDEEISALLTESLRKRGIDIYTEAFVEDAKSTAEGMAVRFKKPGEQNVVSASKVVVAVGVTGNVEDLGLENTKVRVDDANIRVGDWSLTDEPGIYAIGDVAGPPWLAHKASHEGVACVESIAGLADACHVDKQSIPSCTYCYPQVASVGLTERQAVDAGVAITVGRFSLRANGKALAMDESEGMVKTVISEHSGELLGAHMVGSGVTELIGTYVVGRTLETTEVELMHAVLPHPTLSEGLHESVLDAFDRVVHI